MTIKSLIRTIPHYPKPGVQFRDITTLLKDPLGLKVTIDDLYKRYENEHIDKVVGIESRGFMVGTPLAYKLGVGFVPIRKQSKLPAETLGHDYELEYGSNRIEIHVDAIENGERVLLVDDIIATGGTAIAAATLTKKLGGVLVECAFIISMNDLGGLQRLTQKGLKSFSLCSYEGHS